MPISGAVPKPRDQLRTPPGHRNALVHDWVEVPDVPYRGGPDLRKRKRANGRPWPKRALEKWAVWRRMPHCCRWTEGDWEFALDSIELVAQLAERPAYDEDGNYLAWPTAAVKELRDRERVLGTTLDYRRALRIRYVPAGGPAPKQEVVALADYRSL